MRLGKTADGDTSNLTGERYEQIKAPGELKAIGR